jgi:hypothetical protein
MSDQIARIRADRDAFGHMLLDQLNGQEVVAIIARDDGFIDAAAEVKEFFSEYQDWGPFEQEAMSWEERQGPLPLLPEVTRSSRSAWRSLPDRR